jgi:shikimate kinase
MPLPKPNTPLDGIILTGMMGSGKSRIGRILRDRLHWPFSDLDRTIEELAGLSIPDFFAQHGESAFRKAEIDALREVVINRPLVLATGGGALCREEAWEIIPETVAVIWLRAPVNVLADRVKSGKGRPLLQNKDIIHELERLLEERVHWYQRADIHVDVGTGTPEDVAARIIQALDTRRSNK